MNVVSCRTRKPAFDSGQETALRYDDLSTWVFSVGEDGRVVQEVSLAIPANRYRRERRILEGQLAADDIADVMAAAQRGGFDRLADRYSADGWDDLQTTAIAIRLGGQLKRVEAYGAAALAYKGSNEMKLFMDLWRRIEKHLLYGGTQ